MATSSRKDSGFEFYARIAEEVASGKRVPAHVCEAAYESRQRELARIGSEQVRDQLEAGLSAMDAWTR